MITDTQKHLICAEVSCSGFCCKMALDFSLFLHFHQNISVREAVMELIASGIWPDARSIFLKNYSRLVGKCLTGSPSHPT